MSIMLQIWFASACCIKRELDCADAQGLTKRAVKSRHGHKAVGHTMYATSFNTGYGNCMSRFKS